MLLSAVVRFLFVPSNVLFSLCALALLLLILRVRGASAFAAAGLCVSLVAAFSPLGNMMLVPLESRFPYMQLAEEPIAGILVLGGSFDTRGHGYLNTILLKEDSDPMAVIPALAKQYPNARILFSGGSDAPAPEPSEASVAKRYFMSFGIEERRIAVEERSLTTEENARFSADMVHPTPDARWLLVTMAYHEPRAMGAFRKQGFNVIAFPVGARTHGWSDFWRSEKTAADNIRYIDVAAHEWFGLVQYKLSAYSDAWFPGP